MRFISSSQWTFFRTPIPDVAGATIRWKAKRVNTKTPGMFAAKIDVPKTQNLSQDPARLGELTLAYSTPAIADRGKLVFTRYGSSGSGRVPRQRLRVDIEPSNRPVSSMERVNRPSASALHHVCRGAHCNCRYTAHPSICGQAALYR
jgi:hypothetical protein